MGRRDRERIERLEQGKEKSIASQNLSNPIARKAVAIASRGDVIRTLKQATTAEQIETLSSTVAAQRPNKLRRALMKKAPAEMDKAIRIFQKQGRPVTVASLTAEAKSTPSFVAMCEQVGLEMSWFDNLARERMKTHGITEE
jgi:hypothetical protein